MAILQVFNSNSVLDFGFDFVCGNLTFLETDGHKMGTIGHNLLENNKWHPWPLYGVMDEKT